MTAVHLSTAGLSSDWTAITIETTLRRLAGVARVAVMRSLNLVSVMFDEREASPEQSRGLSVPRGWMHASTSPAGGRALRLRRPSLS